MTVEPLYTPLVSVIIRTIGRACLTQALESVAAQTYQPIELVVVDAACRQLQLPAQLSEAVSVRVCTPESALKRSAAANFGLQHAQGQYCLFLDDDDWLHPSHIARLVQALIEHPAAVLAYAGVECVQGEPPQCTQVFDAPYSHARLLSENYIPIHAALFNRSVWAQGCRFDESFDLHEDWDFWLQLAQLGEFVHCPGISASYRMSAEGSGIWAEQQRVQASTQHLLEKWWRSWSAKTVLTTLDTLRRDLHASRQQLDQAHLHAATHEQALTQSLQVSQQYAGTLREQVGAKELELKAAHTELGALQQQNARLHSEISQQLQTIQQQLGVTQQQLGVTQQRLEQVEAQLIRPTVRRLLHRLLGRH